MQRELRHDCQRCLYGFGQGYVLDVSGVGEVSGQLAMTEMCAVSDEPAVTSLPNLICLTASSLNMSSSTAKTYPRVSRWAMG